MPWSPDDAQSHTEKASTEKLQKLWARVANSQLRLHGDEGRAIRVANHVVREIADGN